MDAIKLFDIDEVELMDEVEQRRSPRRRRPNWSELPGDILSLILKHLTGDEVIRLSLVCSSWREMIRDHLTSSSSPSCHAVPWLIFPSRPDEGEDIDGCRFYCVEQRKFFKQRNSVFRDFGKRHCIGSSHGWLILLDESVNPYLLNPFSGTHILLPPLETFGDIVGLSRSCEGDEGYDVLDGSNSEQRRFMSTKELRERFFLKAILTSSPLNVNNVHGVIVVYNNKSKLGYWKHGEMRWKDLDGAACIEGGCYSDIIYYNNRVYALSNTPTGSPLIEIWDFQKHDPIKLKEIKAPLPENQKVHNRPNYGEPKFYKFYLLESLGNLLHVIREGMGLTKRRHTPPGAYVYATVIFKVCEMKLDTEVKEWKALDSLDSLGDRAIFLGGNHTFSLTIPTEDFGNLAGSAIYYTDDSWHWHYNNSYVHGRDKGIVGGNGFIGREVGIIRRGGRDLQLQYHGYLRIEPPPFWIVPNPW